MRKLPLYLTLTRLGIFGMFKLFCGQLFVILFSLVLLLLSLSIFELQCDIEVVLGDELVNVSVFSS